MLTYILARAEYVALVVNVFMFLAFLGTRDFPKAVYWGGTILIVIGVIWMGKSA